MEQDLQKYNADQRLARWTETVARCRSSGMTIHAWCEQEGISEKSYYYWQRKIYKMTCNSPEFIEITSMPQSMEIVAEIAVNGTVASVYRGADSVTLQNLLVAMKQC